MKSKSSSQPTPIKVLGVFEKVDFPEFKMKNITAKMDTGAYTGALHCTNIRLESVDGGKVLHFSPFDHPKLIKTADNFLVRYVKSSNGTREKRYFIETTIIIAKKKYPILLSLADRSEMKWPVLIGRRFLRENNLLVDAGKLKV